MPRPVATVRFSKRLTLVKKRALPDEVWRVAYLKLIMESPKETP